MSSTFSNDLDWQYSTMHNLWVRRAQGFRRLHDMSIRSLRIMLRAIRWHATGRTAHQGNSSLHSIAASKTSGN
jgi:hypothetical protein